MCYQIKHVVPTIPFKFLLLLRFHWVKIVGDEVVEGVF
jgi:hypothetical protein